MKREGGSNEAMVEASGLVVEEAEKSVSADGDGKA